MFTPADFRNVVLDVLSTGLEQERKIFIDNPSTDNFQKMENAMLAFQRVRKNMTPEQVYQELYNVAIGYWEEALLNKRGVLNNNVGFGANG